MSATSLELARAGDINVIATLIEEKVGIKVSASMQWIRLTLEIAPSDVEKCPAIIQVLESIPCKILSIKISGDNWYKVFVLTKTGTYPEVVHKEGIPKEPKAVDMLFW